MGYIGQSHPYRAYLEVLGLNLVDLASEGLSPLALGGRDP